VKKHCYKLLPLLLILNFSLMGCLNNSTSNNDEKLLNILADYKEETNLYYQQIEQNASKLTDFNEDIEIMKNFSLNLSKLAKEYHLDILDATNNIIKEYIGNMTVYNQEIEKITSSLTRETSKIINDTFSTVDEMTTKLKTGKLDKTEKEEYATIISEYNQQTQEYELELISNLLKINETITGMTYKVRGAMKSLENDLKGKLDSMSEMSEMTSLRLQLAMDKKFKFISMLSIMMKKISTTQDILVQNIK